MHQPKDLKFRCPQRMGSSPCLSSNNASQNSRLNRVSPLVPHRWIQLILASCHPVPFWYLQPTCTSPFNNRKNMKRNPLPIQKSNSHPILSVGISNCQLQRYWFDCIIQLKIWSKRKNCVNCWKRARKSYRKFSIKV